MYGYLCDHFAVTKADGLSWENALEIWKQSNPPPKEMKSKTPAPSNNGVNGGNGTGSSQKAKSPQPGPHIGSMRSQTDRGRHLSNNLGADELILSDSGSKHRSPSPAGDRLTRHHRDQSLGGNMRRTNRSTNNITSPHGIGSGMSRSNKNNSKYNAPNSESNNTYTNNTSSAGTNGASNISTNLLPRQHSYTTSYSGGSNNGNTFSSNVAGLFEYS